MPPGESPLVILDRLLKQGDMAGVVRVAGQMLAQSKRSFPALLGRACAYLNLGHLVEADEDIEQAQRLAPSDPQMLLIRAMIDQRLGRIDRAVEGLRRILSARAPQSAEAAVVLAEVLWFAHRHADLAAHLDAAAAWAGDPRMALARLRLRGRADAEGAVVELQSLVARERNPLVRRVAGFEAVGLLDRMGRYREAFDLATRMHAETTPPFDLEGHLADVRAMRAEVEKGACWITPRVDRVEGASLVVGLPRSGTTLLEQMLDRHPAISGIGEYDGIDRIGGALVSMGRWPRGLALAQREMLAAVQQRYLAGARRLQRADAIVDAPAAAPGAHGGRRWTFDKTLRAWRWLPAVAAVLPGAVCFHVARDPRDMAISTFLSYFHPMSDGWTASLASIRRVVEAERAVLPRALEVLQIPHESIVYEDLVADPAAHAARCLARLGLDMDARVLAPEANARAVFTLSHAQVRQPISRASIGRWRNYAFAFDGSWDELGAAHDARCATR